MRFLSDYSKEIQEEIYECKRIVAELHEELVRYNLVVWTAGNVSQRLTSEDLFVIKPSGVRYHNLKPNNMVICDLDGNQIHDTVSSHFKPSSDTAAHAYVYKNMKSVGGIVHTHSTYATAWSAIGKPIPAILTMMGDEFGGDIPVGPFAIIGDDSIGRGIVSTLKSSKSPAVLMQNHGPFTIGKNAEEAVKAAAMCEEVARTVAISLQLGDPISIPTEILDKLYNRYQNVYGQ